MKPMVAHADLQDVSIFITPQLTCRFIDMFLPGRKAISDWKQREGRAKDWRMFPISRLKLRVPLDEILREAGRLSPSHWMSVGAPVPTLMLRRKIQLRRVQIPWDKRKKPDRQHRFSKHHRQVRDVVDDAETYVILDDSKIFAGSRIDFL